MSIPGPQLGPCDPWITATDVMRCCEVVECESPSVFDTVATEASQALYEISGRQFPGICEMTTRPCADRCGCWGGYALGLGPWAWTAAAWGMAPAGWAWRNECGDRCGCGTLSQIRLAGYPVREITEVKIDGVELPETDPVTGVRNWRLDMWRYLVRMDDPGPPVVTRHWPACQNLALDDDQSGTFSISYRWGTDVPDIGIRAACQLACQLWLACPELGAVGDCVLPPGVTRVVRQGVEIDRDLLANWFDPTKSTGLVAVDTFLRAYWPDRSARRTSAVWSPDVQQFGRRMTG